VFDSVTPKLQDFHRRQWSNLDADEIDTLHNLLAKALWGDGGNPEPRRPTDRTVDPTTHRTIDPPEER
jgi:hypothetical protein